MDKKIRDLERRARGGDIEAAQLWLHEAARAKDYAAQYEALMLVCELQHPGLMKQLRETEQAIQAVKIQEPPVDDGVWVTHLELDTKTRRTSAATCETVTALGSSRFRVQVPTSSFPPVAAGGCVHQLVRPRGCNPEQHARLVAW